MAHIVEHLSLRQLGARYRASHDATEARHFQAIWLLAQGRTVLEVADPISRISYEASSPDRSGRRAARSGRPARRGRVSPREPDSFGSRARHEKTRGRRSGYGS